MAYTLFLSHSGQDYDLVRAVQDAARPLGIQVYLFEQDLQPGANLPAKLLDRIKESDAVVVVLTHAAANSPAVNQEIGAARQSGKMIVPLIESGVDPSRFTFLQGLEWLALNREKPEETLLHLTTRLAGLKSEADQQTWVFLLIVAAYVIWLASREG